MKKDKAYFIKILNGVQKIVKNYSKVQEPLYEKFQVSPDSININLSDNEILSFKQDSELVRFANLTGNKHLAILLEEPISERKKLLKLLVSANKYKKARIENTNNIPMFLDLLKEPSSTFYNNYNHIHLNNDNYLEFDNNENLCFTNFTGTWSLRDARYTSYNVSFWTGISTQASCIVGQYNFIYNKHIISDSAFTKAKFSNLYLTNEKFVEIASSSHIKKQPDIIKNAKILL